MASYIYVFQIREQIYKIGFWFPNLNHQRVSNHKNFDWSSIIHHPSLLAFQIKSCSNYIWIPHQSLLKQFHQPREKAKNNISDHRNWTTPSKLQFNQSPKLLLKRVKLHTIISTASRTTREARKPTPRRRGFLSSIRFLCLHLRLLLLNHPLQWATPLPTLITLQSDHNQQNQTSSSSWLIESEFKMRSNICILHRESKRGAAMSTLIREAWSDLGAVNGIFFLEARHIAGLCTALFIGWHLHERRKAA